MVFLGCLVAGFGIKAASPLRDTHVYPGDQL
jgi:hypothetical protein